MQKEEILLDSPRVLDRLFTDNEIAGDRATGTSRRKPYVLNISSGSQT